MRTSRTGAAMGLDTASPTRAPERARRPDVDDSRLACWSGWVTMQHARDARRSPAALRGCPRLFAGLLTLRARVVCGALARAGGGAGRSGAAGGLGSASADPHGVAGAGGGPSVRGPRAGREGA